MNKFYITFGQVHAHRVNGHTFDKDSVGIILAESESKAREIAFELFGPEWFTVYPESEWKEDDLKWFPRGYLPVNYKEDEVTSDDITA